MPIELLSADGKTQLSARWWRVDQEPPAACVVLLHGVHQSGALYRPGGCTPLVSELNKVAKADVLAVDFRGFGAEASGAHSYSVTNFTTTFAADARGALRAAAAAVPTGTPIFLFGHSLGGLVATHLATSDSPPPEVAAYLLSAPSVGPIAAPRALLRCLTHVAPNLPVAAMTAGECTNNAGFIAEFTAASPRMPFTVAYVEAACSCIEETRTRFAAFHKPALILSGPPPPPGFKLQAGTQVTCDMHNVNDAPKELADAITKAGRVACTYTPMAGMPHDLVFERVGDAFPAVEAVVEYVAKFTAAVPTEGGGRKALW